MIPLNPMPIVLAALILQPAADEPFGMHYVKGLFQSGWWAKQSLSKGSTGSEYYVPGEFQRLNHFNRKRDLKGGTLNSLDRATAITTIRQIADSGAVAGFPCSTHDTPLSPLPSYVITAHRMTIRCRNGEEHTFVFSELKRIHVVLDEKGRWVCSRTKKSALCLRHKDFSTLTKTADAFYTLAQIVTTQDPSSDPLFKEAVLRARAKGDRGEKNRRAQVQAEAMLAQNRLEEVERVYIEALEESPDWALGHYNLALVYGTLEYYPEAITEMRRYLYLEPNAPDAREAQDQIYTWEALLPRPAPAR